MLALGWLSVGCGRLNFDAHTSATDGAVEGLAIIEPADLAEVGPTINLRGTCTSGTVDVSGSGVSGAPTAQCASGQFAVIVDLTPGFGDKHVTITQGASSATRTYVRVAQSPLPFTARSSITSSAGPATPCMLEIDAPPGLAPGNLLVGVIHSDGGTDASILTPGFTRLDLDTLTAVGFFKVIGNTEPSRYVFLIDSGTAMGGTCASAGVLVGIKNVDSAIPITTESSLVSFGDKIVAPSVTLPSPSIIVGLFGSNGPIGGITEPAGMTIDPDATPNGSFAVSGGAGNALIAWESVGAGATGPRTATLPGTAPVAGALIGVRPN
ncbi:MAG: hypothetical protein H0V17_31150 [Deltaproteobacteria bacterium]|nr:hypothetical protein [Deltaproteobacteria bacterium]